MRRKANKHWNVQDDEKLDLVVQGHYKVFKDRMNEVPIDMQYMRGELLSCCLVEYELD